MFDIINITKAISDKNRVRVVMALLEAPLCVGQLTHLLSLAPSTTSKHISILQQAKLIESVRKGKWVFYEIISEKKNPLIGEVLALLKKGAIKSDEIKKDKKNLIKIVNEYCDIHNVVHEGKTK